MSDKALLDGIIRELRKSAETYDDTGTLLYCHRARVLLAEIERLRARDNLSLEDAEAISDGAEAMALWVERFDDCPLRCIPEIHARARALIDRVRGAKCE